MELITMKLKDIKPYPNNPRNNDKAVDAVAESIRQCGYVAPIIVDEDGVILAGHTRFKALGKLGWTECRVAVVKDLTDEQKRKYRILDNKTNELAEWDFDALLNELDGLDFDGFDFGLGDVSDSGEIDFELDAEDSKGEKVAVRLLFNDYREYKRNELAVKQFAEEVGAEMSVKSE